MDTDKKFDSTSIRTSLALQTSINSSTNLTNMSPSSSIVDSNKKSVSISTLVQQISNKSSDYSDSATSSFSTVDTNKKIVSTSVPTSLALQTVKSSTHDSKRTSASSDKKSVSSSAPKSFFLQKSPTGSLFSKSSSTMYVKDNSEDSKSYSPFSKPDSSDSKLDSFISKLDLFSLKQDSSVSKRDSTVSKPDSPISIQDLFGSDQDATASKQDSSIAKPISPISKQDSVDKKDSHSSKTAETDKDSQTMSLFYFLYEKAFSPKPRTVGKIARSPRISDSPSSDEMQRDATSFTYPTEETVEKEYPLMPYLPPQEKAHTVHFITDLPYKALRTVQSRLVITKEEVVTEIKLKPDKIKWMKEILAECKPMVTHFLHQAPLTTPKILSAEMLNINSNALGICSN